MINSIISKTKKVGDMANSFIKKPSFKERFPFKTRHDCRHTLATWLSDNGASTQELMKVVKFCLTMKD